MDPKDTIMFLYQSKGYIEGFQFPNQIDFRVFKMANYASVCSSTYSYLKVLDFLGLLRNFPSIGQPNHF